MVDTSPIQPGVYRLMPPIPEKPEIFVTWPSEYVAITEKVSVIIRK